jgi:argininosuccinate lyase/amino-acid N-acetyltransferase
MHLSRLCEDVIFYCTGEAALLQLGDSVSTGSSLMPQKKNPDAAELIRGKTGRVIANLQSLLITMKGLPLAYNKDMQEDKEALFDGVDQWSLCLRIAAKMVATITVNKDNALAAAQGGYSNATELADYLVGKQVPFREAHHIVGEVVRFALEQKKPLEALTLSELQRFHPMVGSDVYPALSIEAALEKRNVTGGVARAQVVMQLHAAKRKLQADEHSDNIVRKATVHDVGAILQLVNHWADVGENLPRSHADIVSHLQDFVVAVLDGKVVGCAALYIYNEEIAEIRSLGVWPQAQGKGIGQQIVHALNQRASDLGLKKVLVLTRVPRFFEKLGFSRDIKQNLPEKVLKDCQFCPKLNACDETALIFWPTLGPLSNAA